MLPCVSGRADGNDKNATAAGVGGAVTQASAVPACILVLERVGSPAAAPSTPLPCYSHAVTLLWPNRHTHCHHTTGGWRTRRAPL